jgi:hypothetical protein
MRRDCRRLLAASALLMVDPECRARASGAARFHWSFTVLGQPDPVTTGARESSRRLRRSLKWHSACTLQAGARRQPPG